MFSVFVLLNNKWTWTVKFFAFLASPIPLALFIPVNILGGAFAGIGVGFFGIVVASFIDGNRDCLAYYGGWGKLGQWIWDMTLEYVKQNKNMLEDMNNERIKPLPPGVEKLDIKLIELFTALVIGIIGMIVVVPLWVLISALKFVPALVRGYYLMWYTYFTEGGSNSDTIAWRCVCFPVFLVANALFPVLCVLGLALSYLYAIAGGLAASVVYYKFGFKSAFIYMIVAINKADCESTKLIFPWVGSDYRGCMGCSAVVDREDVLNF